MIPEFFHDVVQILSTSSNILTVKKKHKIVKSKNQFESFRFDEYDFDYEYDFLVRPNS